jgi:3-deoxy-7-phosphoheptulonate synthase / chorismate mutase
MKNLCMRILFLSVTSLVGCLVFAGDDIVNDTLAANRQKIDKIDQQIVALINQRAAVVDRIGQIKSAAALPVSAPNREREVLKKVADLGHGGPFPASRLQNIYSTLLTQMREWEEERHPSKK